MDFSAQLVALASTAVYAGQVISTAMWVLLGSMVLLRDLEKVTLRTIVGTCAAVGGTILLALNK